jgi:hypothetical protein
MFAVPIRRFLLLHWLIGHVQVEKSSPVQSGPRPRTTRTTDWWFVHQSLSQERN